MAKLYYEKHGYPDVLVEMSLITGLRQCTML